MKARGKKLSGWVFLIFMVLGGMLSVKLFAKHVSTLPEITET